MRFTRSSPWTAVAPFLDVAAIRSRLRDADLAQDTRGEAKKKSASAPPPTAASWGSCSCSGTRTGEPLAIFPDGVIQRMRFAPPPDWRRISRRGRCARWSRCWVMWLAGRQPRCGRSSRCARSRWCAASVPMGRGAKRSRARSGIDRHRRGRLRLAAGGREGGRRGAVRHQQHVAGVLRRLDRERASISARCSTRSCIRTVQGGGCAGRALFGPARGDRFRAAAIVHSRDHGGHLRARCSRPSARRPCPNLHFLVLGCFAGAEALPRQFSAFLNYVGLGYQFAALGAVLYRNACARGIGRDLPTDWFTEDVNP